MRVRTSGLIVALAFLVGLAAPVGAEQLTTVGVVDMEQILNEFFTQSEAVREWRQNVEEFDEQRRQIEEEISDLEEERLDELSAGNESEALSIEERIDERRDFLSEFTRIRRNRLQREREALLDGSDSFFDQVNTAMSFVAQSEGYTLVMDAESQGMLWFSDEVDITDDVISRLRETLE